MEKTAHEIQKERIAEIEAKTAKLLDSVSVVTLTSINENGFSRTGLLTKYRNDGFADNYLITSKRSKLNGKATHFEHNPKANVCYFSGRDSVTLIGNVEFVGDSAMQQSVWDDADRRFFSKEIDNPKFCLLKFHTIEATFWIEGKFRTCKYK